MPVEASIATSHPPPGSPRIYRLDPVKAPREDVPTTGEALADLAIYQGFLVAGAGFEPATFGL
jgi:hypothetical protein